MIENSIFMEVLLGDGKKMPMVGLGTCRSNGKVLHDTIYAAISTGYRLFDCAHVYGNEQDLGVIFKEIFEEKLCSRKDLFIASKLGMSSNHPDNVKAGFDLTLQNLQLGYLDLYYMHWPFTVKYDGPDNFFPTDPLGKPLFDESVDYLDTWHAIEELYLSGKVKALGVCNFNIMQLERLLKNCRVAPIVHQFECHPYLNQTRLIDFCQSHSIIPVAYSPLCGSDRKTSAQIDVFSDPVLKSLERKYKKSIAQIVLRYQIQRNVCVIPRSTNKDRIAENYNVFDFALSSNDFGLISNLNKDIRVISADRYAEHKHFPF